MPENIHELAWVVIRSSGFLTATFVLVWCLLKYLRIQSARIHTVAWSGVLLQGVILMPLHIEVPVMAAPEPENEYSQPFAIVLSELSSPAATVAQRDSRAAISESQPGLIMPLSMIAVSLWIAGVILSVVWLPVSYVRFLASLPRTRSPEEEWLKQFAAIRTEMRLRQHIALHVTDDCGPAICWTPSGYRILIPADHWANLPSLQREFVLRHELAHIRRGDLWKGLLIRLTASVQWFNPLACIAVRKLTECAEWSCDEIVRKSATSRSTEYVRALMEFSVRYRIPAFVPTAAGHSLVRRAQRLLTPKIMEDSAMKKTIITLLVAGLAIANGLVVELVAQDDKIPATPGSAAAALAEKSETTITQTAKPDAAISLLSQYVDIKNADGSPSVMLVNDEGGILSQVVADPSVLANSSVAEPPSGALSVAGANASLRRAATKEAVIDIAHVFRNLPEFRRAQESMKKQTELLQQRYQAEVAAVKIIQEQLAASEYGSNVDVLRAELAERMGKLEIEKNRMQEQIRLSEARLYASGFKSIRKAIADYAKENDIHIVRRATMGRELQGQLDSGDPKAVFQAMQEQVLYVAEDGIDITDAVLDRLKTAATAKQSEQ